jgi:hypothetical protein
MGRYNLVITGCYVMKSKVACRIVEISKGADEHNYSILAVARLEAPHRIGVERN